MANQKKKGHKRLTIAELKKCKGFEDFTPEQAEETIATLEKLSIFFYELYMKQKREEEAKEELSLNKKTESHERKSDHGQQDAA